MYGTFKKNCVFLVKISFFDLLRSKMQFVFNHCVSLQRIMKLYDINAEFYHLLDYAFFIAFYSPICSIQALSEIC